MSLKARIEQEMKDAMRARDEGRLKAIRLLRAAIQRREVDERTTLDDQQVLAVVDKLVKQGRDAASQFAQAQRQDLADTEARDIAVWNEFLPAPLSESEIDGLIGEALSQTGAATARDLGKVVGWLKPKVQGRADLSRISAKIKDRLAQ